MLVGAAIIPYSAIAFAQQSQNTSSKTLQFSNADISSLLKPGNTTYNTVLLDAKMLQLAASNKPKDIATLAYIWGYPLVTVVGSYVYYTTKGVPSQGEGHVNTINFARSLSNTIRFNIIPLSYVSQQVICYIQSETFSSIVLCNSLL